MGTHQPPVCKNFERKNLIELAVKLAPLPYVLQRGNSKQQKKTLVSVLFSGLTVIIINILCCTFSIPYTACMSMIGSSEEVLYLPGAGAGQGKCLCSGTFVLLIMLTWDITPSPGRGARPDPPIQYVQTPRTPATSIIEWNINKTEETITIASPRTYPWIYNFSIFFFPTEAMSSHIINAY